MRIGIDARFLTHPQRGGFKTYTENLVRALPQVDPTNEYILYLDRPPQEQTRLPKCPNVSHRIVAGQVPVIGMPWREHVGLAYRASIDNLDLLHSPCLTAPFWLSCARVVTIHDMIWRHPEHSAGNKRALGRRMLMQWYYRLVPLHAARKAAVILTVSQASKDRIVESLRVLPALVLVTHEAASRIFRRIEEARFLEAGLKRYGLRRLVHSRHRLSRSAQEHCDAVAGLCLNAAHPPRSPCAGNHSDAFVNGDRAHSACACTRIIGSSSIPGKSSGRGFGTDLQCRLPFRISLA